jgi:hypothetical protein
MSWYPSFLLEVMWRPRLILALGKLIMRKGCFDKIKVKLLSGAILVLFELLLIFG